MCAKVVVGNDGGRGKESRSRRNQGFRDARRDGTQTRTAAPAVNAS